MFSFFLKKEKLTENNLLILKFLVTFIFFAKYTPFLCHTHTQRFFFLSFYSKLPDLKMVIFFIA